MTRATAVIAAAIVGTVLAVGMSSIDVANAEDDKHWYFDVENESNGTVNELRTQLHRDRSPRRGLREDPTSQAVARFKHRDPLAICHELGGGREPCSAGADDDRVPLGRYAAAGGRMRKPWHSEMIFQVTVVQRQHRLEPAAQQRAF